MVPSAVFNEAIIVITILAFRTLVLRTPREKLPGSFRYFTVLSNLFCALTALILLLCELWGAMPAWAVTLKYVGTAAVTVTFLTVFLFLLPMSKTINGLLSNPPERTMHLYTPVLAILSFLCFEKGELSAWIIPLGLLPVALYGGVYLERVILSGAWEDLYGFNRNGKWKRSFVCMILGAAAVAVLLWAL